MLEHYFTRTATINRIRNAWLGEAIERYVVWLHEHGYAAHSILARVPLLVQFSAFAQARGATTWEQLPAYIEGFVADWVKTHSRWCHNEADRRGVVNATRYPIQQLLKLMLPDTAELCQGRLAEPFLAQAPGFFVYLRQERGLQESTIGRYAHYLRRFEAYLKQHDVHEFGVLSPPLLSAFITASHEQLGKRTLLDLASVLRIFLGYLYRERLLSTPLGRTVEAPRRYRLADVPCGITADEVGQLLSAVDRRSAVGKRDYALLRLLLTYGLRAREVAALTLDALDWQRERLLITGRKAGHSAAYPLTPLVGEALIGYLQEGRPKSGGRALFFRAMAPYTPLSGAAISQRAAYYLHKAGLQVPRAGSHTLRHTCVQRLVDAEFSLKAIGDYVGHRSPAATEVYTKVAIEALREVALGDGEAML